MKKVTSAALMLFFVIVGCAVSQPTTPKDGSRVLRGNIYGAITDRDTKAPVAGALIYVTDRPARFLSEKTADAVLSDEGWIDVPPVQSAVAQTVSKSDGTYIVGNIPLTRKYATYTVVMKAKNRDTIVIDQVPVLPGASMALKIDCRMTRTGTAEVIRVFKGHRNIDINYSDELKQPPG